MAAAAAAAAARSSAAAAARHVISDVGPFTPLFPRRWFAAGTTALPAARTRPLPPKCAGEMIPDDCFYPAESQNSVPICWFNPEAPADPATYFNYGEEDLASEEAMWAMYERWCAYHGVERGRDDMLRRFGRFKDKARSIHEFNQSGASYTMHLAKSADHTAEERAEYYRRFFPPRS